MNIIFRLFLASLCCVFAAASPARAEIVNIGGTHGIINGVWTPLGVSFEAGSYTVTPVTPTTPGALYTAYYFGSSVDVWGAGYGIALSQNPGDLRLYGGSSFATAELAFAHAVGASFSLANRQTVYFGVLDSYYGDNSGGVSLSITAVPEPETYAMMLAGLGLLGVTARRRKQISVA